MQGKYSPTVSDAYNADQRWHDAICKDGTYDDEGYDSYGYDGNDRDRAGNLEYAYAHDDVLYFKTFEDWSFDGTRPVTDVILIATAEQLRTSLKEVRYVILHSDGWLTSGDEDPLSRDCLDIINSALGDK